MNLNEWNQFFSPVILRRGEDYYYSGAVLSMELRNDTIIAEVSGMSLYHVKIYAPGGTVRNMECDCPYAADGHDCKHMAAVLFAAGSNRFPSAQTDAPVHPSPSVEKIVRFLNEERMRDFLLRMAKVYPVVAERLILEATGQITPEEIQLWTRKIIAMTMRYSGGTGYMDKNTAELYCKALRELLHEKIPMLLEARLPFDAFTLTLRAFSEAHEACRENPDAISDLFWNCRDAWKKMFRSMSDAEYKRTFPCLLERYGKWRLVAADMDTLLFDEEFQDEEFLLKKLDFLDKRIALDTTDDEEREHLETLRQKVEQQLPSEQLFPY